MYCQNCGKELNKGISFCSNCGKPIKSIKIIKHKKHSIKCFIASGCSMLLSIVCAVVANYLNETALSGNAVEVVKNFGNTQEIMWIAFRDKLQTSTAYAFIVLLIVAITLLIVGVVLNIKEKKKIVNNDCPNMSRN